MSTANHKESVCPNCNSPVHGNYCTECGQQAHLHEDSFIGLVSHFISHYFHFESKFWISLKNLIIHPGRLALAYHNKQRMRYVQPISLYILVSAVFFILFSFTMKYEQTTTGSAKTGLLVTERYSLGLYGAINSNKHEKAKWVTDNDCDSLRQVKIYLREAEDERKDYFKKADNQFRFSKEYFWVTFYNYFISPFAYRHQMYDMDAPVNLIYTEFFHLIPKIFFVLMPLLAILLYMAFFKKKEYKFVDYAVMSLHTHVFMFVSAMVLILVIGSFTDASDSPWLFLFIVLIPLIHFLISCRNFFRKTWFYTLVAGTITWAIYLATVIVVSIAILLIMINYT